MSQTNQEIEEEIVLLQSEASAALWNRDGARLTAANLRIRGLREILEARKKTGGTTGDALNGAEKTGAAGRPPLMPLVHVEADQRRKSGQTERRLAAEAMALFEWLKGAHPDKRLPALKTIKNQIRDDHRGIGKRPKIRPKI